MHPRLSPGNQHTRQPSTVSRFTELQNLCALGVLCGGKKSPITESSEATEKAQHQNALLAGGAAAPPYQKRLLVRAHGLSAKAASHQPALPRSLLQLALLVMFVFLPLEALFGIERFPPPEFESGYVMPTTTTPAPRASYMEHLDAAVLLGTLSLASYLVLKRRARKPIFLLMLFSLLYFGFYRKGCICAVGSIQDVALAVFSGGYRVPWTVLWFFLLPLLFTLFFGRAFCAAVCPLGAMQDVMLVRPWRMWPWLEHTLGLLPFVYLGAAILFAATGSAFIICQYDPFVSFFRRSGSFNRLALGAGFLALATCVGRPYCRFLCPYGAMLNVLSRFSKWHVTLSPQDCIRCQLCEVACPFGAIREPLPKDADVPIKPAWAKIIALSLLVPIGMAAGAWLSRPLAVPLSHLNPTVALAERVAAEDAGVFTDVTEASKAFHQTGQPAADLYAEALRIRERFAFGATLLGVFLGLVFSLKLLGLGLDLGGVDTYEADPASCLACGRCYTYCPKEMVRQKRFNRQKTIPIIPVPLSSSGPKPSS